MGNRVPSPSESLSAEASTTADRTRPMAPHLLIVDDDPTVRESLADALERPNLRVSTAGDGEEALALLGGDRPDLVLTDVRMPGMDGVELLRRIRQRVPSAQVILMTAHDDMPSVVAAMREGAREFLVKPLDLAELRALVDRTLAEARRPPPRGGDGEPEPSPRDDPEEYRLDRLVGRDPAMIQIFKVVGQAAANQVNVLIRGESGTGKELIARAVHFNSPAASEPFVPVNCTAIPATLLESELFGHVKGSFTGATADRKGRFAVAGRGTLFLDEVGDTPPEFQAKLLRVIQEQEFYPVGADRPQRTEARIIAATHRDLEAAVDDERFRADLYFRLRVLEIRIPPLRDRKGDIPELARHLLARIARTLDRPAPSISDEAMKALTEYNWPGNVREMENALTRALVVATGGVVHPRHLDLAGTPAPSGAPLRSLDEVEEEHVRRVLEATDWHKTRSAEILDISRPRLNRLIDKYELE
jgi:DNA-binding NtrC family response regulator